MKYAIVDFRTSEEEKRNLSKFGLNILICPPSALLYDAICGHPDILLHIVNKQTIMVHKDMNIDFVDKLKSLGLKIIFSKTSLSRNYPNDIILNSININNLFVHNLKFTDSNLINYIANKKTINVRQGYTKCSTAIVTESAIITSDKSIASALSKENVDVLLLPPGDIELPGLDYGFIGGSSGLIDTHTMAFFGDLNYYIYGKKVKEFIEKHNVEAVFLREDKLIDRGSIFVIEV